MTQSQAKRPWTGYDYVSASIHTHIYVCVCAWRSRRASSKRRPHRTWIIKLCNVSSLKTEHQTDHGFPGNINSYICRPTSTELYFVHRCVVERGNYNPSTVLAREYNVQKSRQTSELERSLTYFWRRIKSAG